MSILDALTDEQRACAEELKRPLFVSAGAGSGKTHTLTTRIVWALLPESESGISSIDRILAITFTEKAAAEIKARVKAYLRQAGKIEDALQVDGAWISTIHGMCSRILHAHALELDLDPHFSVLDQKTCDDLIAESIDEVLGEENDIIGGNYQELRDEYAMNAIGYNSTSITAMVSELISLASGRRDGFENLDFGPEPRTAPALANEAALITERAREWLDTGTSDTAKEAVAQADETLARLQSFQDEAAAHPQGGSSDLKKLVVALGMQLKLKNVGKKELRDEYKLDWTSVVGEIRAALARPLLDLLITVARNADAAFQRRKQERFALDNDDLIKKTLEALVDHPRIAAEYCNRFQLVMVDEFQDTNQMQVDLIKLLSGKDCERLCTIGDAQQAIYRFRGSDVRVYEAQRAVMLSSCVNAKMVEMKRNFRSHADILAFVDRVFEQPGSFGDGFMSLAPYEERRSRYVSTQSRIALVTAKGAAADCRREIAAGMAKRFAAMRAEGQDPGDMVVLLGKMTNAHLYAEALRDEGFECVVTGGSGFSETEEATIVKRLLQVLADRKDAAALFDILTSNVFSLDANDMLLLGTKFNEAGSKVKRDIADGFDAAIRGDIEHLSQRLDFACRIMEVAWGSIRTSSLSQVALDVVARSGWLGRLRREGADGMAAAGNVIKAIRLVDDLEREGVRGSSQIAREFTERLDEGMKQAPGALSGSGTHVVRIMTIHASKGLEFPVVGLAEFARSSYAPGKLLCENIDGATRISLDADRSVSDTPLGGTLTMGEIMGDDIDKMSDAVAFRNYIHTYGDEEDLAETRRKLYVGLTRASEALVVGFQLKKNGTASNVADEIRSALYGENPLVPGMDHPSYGGSQPASVSCVVAEPPEEEHAPERQENAVRSIPVFAEPRLIAVEVAHGYRNGVFSYSSLEKATSSKREKPVAPLGITDDLDEAAIDEGKRLSATDFGTLFHRLAQYAIVAGKIPDTNRRDALCREVSLDSEGRTRLDEDLDRWFASKTYKRAIGYARRRAEVPFLIDIGDCCLEGEIDLLADGGIAQPALIIDYKTGGSDAESSEDLQVKHLLQAQCYALALLRQGYPAVELEFVRIERKDAADASQPQTVSYHFEGSDRADLERIVVERYRAAKQGCGVKECAKTN